MNFGAYSFVKELDEPTTRVLQRIQSELRGYRLRGHVVIWIDGDEQAAAAWSAKNGIPAGVIAGNSQDLKDWKIDADTDMAVVLAESRHAIGTMLDIEPDDPADLNAKFMMVAAWAHQSKMRWAKRWGPYTLKRMNPTGESLRVFLNSMASDNWLEPQTVATVLASLDPSAKQIYEAFRTDPKDPKPYVRILQDYGIQPTSLGLSQFLRMLDPALAPRLAEELHSDRFQTRERATRQLQQLSKLAVPHLVKITRETDPEASWRANNILRWIERQGNKDIRLAVLQTIRRNNVPVPVNVIFNSFVWLDEDHLRAAARQALVAISQSKDADVIHKALKHSDGHTRAAAVNTLAKISTRHEIGVFEELLTDKNDWVRLASAIALSSRGQSSALKPLINLLSSHELRVRARSGQVLRTITGKSFGYQAFAELADQKRSVRAWQEWVSGDGRGAALLALDDTRLETAIDGRFRIAIKGECKLFLNGRLVWATNTGGTRWSDQLLLRPEDVLVVQFRSKWVYRAMRMAFVSTDQQTIMPFHRSDFRHIEELELPNVNISTITQASRQMGPGRPDRGFKSAWSNLHFAEDDSEWMWGWKKNSWHQIACVVKPTMFKLVSDDRVSD